MRDGRFEENEGQVEAFLQRSPGWTIVRPKLPDDMITAEGYFHGYPHLHGTDGFFGALMRRSKG